MKPVEFEGANVVYAKDQPQYLPLPAQRTKEGVVTTCWEITDEEIEEIKINKKIFIRILTFNSSLQPILPSTQKID